MIAAISLPSLFFIYVGAVATIAAVTLAQTLSARKSRAAFVILAVWFGYSGALSYLVLTP